MDKQDSPKKSEDKTTDVKKPVEKKEQAAAKPEPAKQEDQPVFTIKRFQIASNVVLQIILVAFLVGLANYMAFRYYKRWDKTHDQKYALSSQTTQLLENLRGELKFIVFFSPASLVYSDLENLLKEYQYAGGKQVSIEYIDPYRNFTRARELQGKYKFGAEENLVIIDYRDRTKFVSEADMAELDESGLMFGEPPSLVAFKGEQALTSGVLEVSQDSKGQLYYIQGLGGPEIGDESPLTALTQFIERQYINFNGLDLGEIDEIPEDASAVMLAGPQYDLGERELEVLTNYWNNNGRIIILLDPSANTPRIKQFLQTGGITPNNDRVLRTVNLDQIVGILRDVSAFFVPESPTTKGLENVSTLFQGETQSLDLDSDGVAALGIQQKPLIIAADGFWGELDYPNEEGEAVIFEPKEDTAPPVIIAASVEKGGLGDTTVKVDSSRLVVVGNSSFILDETMTEAHLDFIINSINWLADRENAIGIPPKAVTEFNLALSEGQVSTLGLLTMLAIPAIAAILGIFVYYARRG